MYFSKQFISNWLPTSLLTRESCNKCITWNINDNSDRVTGLSRFPVDSDLNGEFLSENHSVRSRSVWRYLIRSFLCKHDDSTNNTCHLRESRKLLGVLKACASSLRVPCCWLYLCSAFRVIHHNSVEDKTNKLSNLFKVGLHKLHALTHFKL